MKNLLNNPWVVVGLCILAAVMVYYRLFDSKSRPAPAPVAQAQAQAQAQASPVAALPAPVVQGPAPGSPQPSISLEDIEINWPKEFRRDPFQPDSATNAFIPVLPQNNVEGGESPLPSAILELRAVFVEGQTRMAMINRELLKEGEQIHGYVVDQIQRERVLLKGQDETRWLEFSVTTKEAPSISLNEGGSEASIDKEIFAS